MADSQLTEMVHAQMPFSFLLGLEVVSAGPDEVVATARWKPEHCTAGGIMHGGYLMAQADSVGALCAYLNLPDGATTSTIESKTNFMRPVTEGEVTLRSEPVHVGRSVIVVETDATREDGKLVARTTQTQTVGSGS